MSKKKQRLREQELRENQKFKLGNNFGTRLILFGIFAVFLVIGILCGIYITQYNSHSTNPFIYKLSTQTDSDGNEAVVSNTKLPTSIKEYLFDANEQENYDLDNLNKDELPFDFELKLTKYQDVTKETYVESDSDEDTLDKVVGNFVPDSCVLTLNIRATENTSKLKISSSSNYIYAYTCMYSNWVGDESYSTKQSISVSGLKQDSNSQYTFDLKSSISYPAKAVWPIYVNKPKFAVFFYYIERVNGKDTKRRCVFFYDYEDISAGCIGSPLAN